jgi:hypothetical protein
MIFFSYLLCTPLPQSGATPAIGGPLPEYLLSTARITNAASQQSGQRQSGNNGIRARLERLLRPKAVVRAASRERRLRPKAGRLLACNSSMNKGQVSGSHSGPQNVAFSAGSARLLFGRISRKVFGAEFVHAD